MPLLSCVSRLQANFEVIALWADLKEICAGLNKFRQALVSIGFRLKLGIELLET